MEQTVETVVGKLSFLDLFLECGLEDDIVCDGETVSLAPESFFHFALAQIEICVDSYNGLRDQRLESIKANKKLAEYCLRKHIQENGKGISMHEKTKSTLLRLFGSPLYFWLSSLHFVFLFFLL